MSTRVVVECIRIIELDAKQDKSESDRRLLRSLARDSNKLRGRTIRSSRRRRGTLRTDRSIDLISVEDLCSLSIRRVSRVNKFQLNTKHTRSTYFKA